MFFVSQYENFPLKNVTPRMPNTTNKNTKITKILKNSGIALNKDCIAIFNPGYRFSIRNGLRTLRSRKILVMLIFLLVA